MKRAFVYLTALVGMGGAVYLAGATRAQQPGGAPAPTPAPAARPTMAVFNMAAVMRDYGKAKYQVYLLNEERVRMSGDLVQWRNQYIQVQQDAQKAPDPKVKEELAKQLLDLARKIEDKDRDINKTLNDKASGIIGTLYDEIKSVVDKTAEMNGYHVVFAYPDAVTPDELKNPLLKELKLKPPAAQPFYVARHVDVTGVVIDALNKWYPPKDAQGQPVDVSKLPQPGTSGGIPGTSPTPGSVPQPGGAPAPAAGVPPRP